MTFWDFLENHGTKLLGLAQGAVALIAVAQVIPPEHVKYWLLASAMLTYWRGQVNSTNQEKLR